MKPKGWTKESYRHYLAAKGVATGRRYNAVNLSFTKGVADRLRDFEKSREEKKEARRTAEQVQLNRQVELGKQTELAPLTSREEAARDAAVLQRQQSARLQIIRTQSAVARNLEKRADELNALSRILELSPVERALGPRVWLGARAKAYREFLEKYDALESDIRVLEVQNRKGIQEYKKLEEEYEQSRKLDFTTPEGKKWLASKEGEEYLEKEKELHDKYSEVGNVVRKVDKTLQDVREKAGKAGVRV